MQAFLDTSAGSAHTVAALTADGQEPVPVHPSVIEEIPVAFRYNDFPHAVMMATPADLSDFAFGFSLTEGIIEDTSGIAHLKVRELEDGFVLDITLSSDSLRRYLRTRRVRQLRGHTSCGICGTEDLADIRPVQKRVPPGVPLRDEQIRAALDRLRDFQPISRSTHGAHAAAWVAPDNDFRLIREDVGRHNALDKLIGAGLRGAFSAPQGYCLITSRCSFEMAQKAIMAGYSTLACASAPTALAIRTASSAGLSLYARCGDRYPRYGSGPESSAA